MNANALHTQVCFWNLYTVWAENGLQVKETVLCFFSAVKLVKSLHAWVCRWVSTDLCTSLWVAMLMQAIYCAGNMQYYFFVCLDVKLYKWQIGHVVQPWKLNILESGDLYFLFQLMKAGFASINNGSRNVEMSFAYFLDWIKSIRNMNQRPLPERALEYHMSRPFKCKRVGERFQLWEWLFVSL